MRGPNEKVFRGQHGNLLSLVNDDFEEWAMRTLLQFYDPQLGCFTFWDYQLAPTLEEYAHIMDVKLTNGGLFVQVPETTNYVEISRALYLTRGEVESNWINKRDTSGLPLNYLVSKAKVFVGGKN